MPFKHAEDKAAWRRKYRKDGRHNAVFERYIARKLGFEVRRNSVLTREILDAVENRLRPKYYEMLCQGCSKPFFGRQTRLYCSKTCSIRADTIRRSKKNIFHKRCCVCEEEFEAHHPRNKTCCKAHSKENERRRRNIACRKSRAKTGSAKTRREKNKAVITAMKSLGLIDREVVRTAPQLGLRNRKGQADRDKINAKHRRQYWKNRTIILAAKELGIVEG